MNGRAEIATTTEEQAALLLDRNQVKQRGGGEAKSHDVLRQPAKHVAIRVHPERIASSDHSKLRGAY